MYLLTGVLGPYFCSCLQKSCWTQKSGRVGSARNEVMSVVVVVLVERSLHVVVSNRTVLALILLTDDVHIVELSRFKVLESSLNRSWASCWALVLLFFGESGEGASSKVESTAIQTGSRLVGAPVEQCANAMLNLTRGNPCCSIVTC
jgi:hypothetical protein